MRAQIKSIGSTIYNFSKGTAGRLLYTFLGGGFVAVWQAGYITFVPQSPFQSCNCPTSSIQIPISNSPGSNTLIDSPESNQQTVRDGGMINDSPESNFQIASESGTNIANQERGIIIHGDNNSVMMVPIISDETSDETPTSGSIEEGNFLEASYASIRISNRGHENLSYIGPIKAYMLPETLSLNGIDSRPISCNMIENADPVILPPDFHQQQFSSRKPMLYSIRNDDPFQLSDDNQYYPGLESDIAFVFPGGENSYEYRYVVPVQVTFDNNGEEIVGTTCGL